MKKEERLKNIENMEKIFNELEISLKDMEKSFKKRKRLYPKFKKLMDYYGSNQRKKDYDDVNNEKLKPEGPHGILSEDAIYDFYENQRELCDEIVNFQIKFQTVKKIPAKSGDSDCIKDYINFRLTGKSAFKLSQSGFDGFGSSSHQLATLSNGDISEGEI